MTDRPPRATWVGAIALCVGLVAGCTCDHQRDPDAAPAEPQCTPGRLGELAALSEGVAFATELDWRGTELFVVAFDWVAMRDGSAGPLLTRVGIPLVSDPALRDAVRQAILAEPNRPRYLFITELRGARSVVVGPAGLAILDAAEEPRAGVAEAMAASETLLGHIVSGAGPSVARVASSCRRLIDHGIESAAVEQFAINGTPGERVLAAAALAGAEVSTACPVRLGEDEFLDVQALSLALLNRADLGYSCACPSGAHRSVCDACGRAWATFVFCRRGA